MKNIHLIPTEKPSRLYLVKSNNKLDITSNNPEYTENFGSGTQNQHIYITSYEEIKDGDWCYQVELNDGKVDKCYDVTLYHTWTNNGVDKTRKFKKIILTTDQDLIKDGVQAIDDEFLEWFVKNPSCEEIEVDRIELNTDYRSDWKQKFRHKVIIPKEEPKQEQKQHLIDMMKGDEELGLYEEPKQETLEEAAEKFAINIQTKAGTMSRENAIEWFKAGFRYQAKIMYSDEEIKKLIINFLFERGIGREVENVEEWFKQFKKN